MDEAPTPSATPPDAPAPEPAVLAAEGLRKAYGEVVALDADKCRSRKLIGYSFTRCPCFTSASK